MLDSLKNTIEAIVATRHSSEKGVYLIGSCSSRAEQVWAKVFKASLKANGRVCNKKHYQRLSGSIQLGMLTWRLALPFEGLDTAWNIDGTPNFISIIGRYWKHS